MLSSIAQVFLVTVKRLVSFLVQYIYDKALHKSRVFTIKSWLGSFEWLFGTVVFGFPSEM